MSELDAKEREDLKDSDFAFPKERKEPIYDAATCATRSRASTR